MGRSLAVSPQTLGHPFSGSTLVPGQPLVGSNGSAGSYHRRMVAAADKHKAQAKWLYAGAILAGLVGRCYCCGFPEVQ